MFLTVGTEKMDKNFNFVTYTKKKIAIKVVLANAKVER